METERVYCLFTVLKKTEEQNIVTTYVIRKEMLSLELFFSFLITI